MTAKQFCLPAHNFYSQLTEVDEAEKRYVLLELQKKKSCSKYFPFDRFTPPVLM